MRESHPRQVESALATAPFHYNNLPNMDFQTQGILLDLVFIYVVRGICVLVIYGNTGHIWNYSYIPYQLNTTPSVYCPKKDDFTEQLPTSVLSELKHFHASEMTLCGSSCYPLTKPLPSQLCAGLQSYNDHNFPCKCPMNPVNRQQNYLTLAPTIADIQKRHINPLTVFLSFIVNSLKLKSLTCHFVINL